MLLVLGWIALSVVFGIAASKRGRSGFGWAVLALLISPLLAGLLLLLLPCRAAFEARYIHEGIPFQLVGRRQVEAMIDGARIRFASLEQFQLAVAVRKRAAAPNAIKRLPRARITAACSASADEWRRTVRALLNRV